MKVNLRYTALCATWISVMAFSGVVSAQEHVREVTVGVFTTAVPFSYIQDGKVTGLSNDILREIAKIEHLKIDYVPLKFDALIPALQAKQIDIAVSGIFITEARKRVVDFSLPYYTQGAIVVVPEKSTITSLSGLKGKKIAAEQGSAALATVQNYKDKWGVSVRTLQDASNMQMAMYTGDVDAMIYDSGVMAYQMDKEKNNPKIKAISDVIDPTGVGFAFQKGSDLVDIINDGLNKMQSNGDLVAIQKQYHLK